MTVSDKRWWLKQEAPTSIKSGQFTITLTRIQEAAVEVDIELDEIANAASDLANGTGEQASAIEELTATISVELAASATELEGLVKRFKLHAGS